MTEFIKNDKALVIVAVTFLVFSYILVAAIFFNILDTTVLNSTLTGMFGVAVGSRLRGGDTPTPPTNGGAK